MAEFEPFPDPLAKLQAGANAHESERTAARASATAARLASLPQQLIKVPDATGDTGYMAYGEYGGSFEGSIRTSAFTPKLNQPEKGKFMLSFGTVNGVLPVNSTSSFAQDGSPTFVWLEITYDGEMNFVSSEYQTGAVLPGIMTATLEGNITLQNLRIPVAAVYFTSKGSLDYYESALSRNIITTPVVTNVSATTITSTLLVDSF